MLFRSKTLHLQHKHEDFDEIAKKSANAKVSLFQRTILYLVESIPSENLEVIVSKAANISLIQSNVRKICDNELIKDGEETVGTVSSNSYTCRLFSTVRRIKRTLVENTLRTICKSLALEICKEIMCHIEYKMNPMYSFIYEDQNQEFSIHLLKQSLLKRRLSSTQFVIQSLCPVVHLLGHLSSPLTLTH